jgi:hypothetical protein
MKIDPCRVSCRSAQLFIALSTLATSSFAADWYVDAASGNNANPGTSPGAAWRTITHAMLAAPDAPAGGTQVIHVARGLYDTALGESFPIVLRDAFQLIGDQGRDATVIDAGGAGSLLYSHQYQGVPGGFVGPLTLVQGLTLQNGDIGIDLYADVGTGHLTVMDARITGMRSAGISDLNACVPGTCGAVVALLSGVEITGCQTGIDFETVGQFNHNAAMTLENRDVSRNALSGIYHHSTAPESTLSCTRVRLVGNRRHGIELEEIPLLSGSMSNQLSDCLFARNRGSGIHATAIANAGIPIGVELEIVRCTIADNVMGGLDAYYTTPSLLPNLHTTLTGSILFGNGDDVIENPAHLSIANPAFNDIGDGDFAGSNGNISADPLFRDAASFDYRLRWGSPCIDSGDPATPAGALDLLGVKRPVDGNLDTLESADIGAFEFTPLWIQRGAHIGKNLVFELWGPSAGTATLYLGRGLPQPTPQSTPFGEFDLDPAAFRNLGASPIAPGPPALRSLSIPNDPLYIGQTFSFQALATSSVITPAMAYTNPVTVTVLP